MNNPLGKRTQMVENSEGWDNDADYMPFFKPALYQVEIQGMKGRSTAQGGCLAKRNGLFDNVHY